MTSSIQTIMTLRITQIVYEADNILRYVLADPAGVPLPPFTAGAHIDLHLPGGLVRPYSLCGDPADRSRYDIAVLRDEKGRGGSKALHDTLRAGGLISVSAPRNQFPLAETATRHLLLAGGIGVTPMIAMIYTLVSLGQAFEMHFCTRAPEVTAFRNFLAPRIANGSVILHHDNGDPARGLDIQTLLKDPESGTHLYYCGPVGFMDAVKGASAHWPKGTVHFEYFSSPADPIVAVGGDGAFQVKIKDTGEVFEVPADKTIVSVLRDNGYAVDTQCEEGFCGTCMTRYVEGEADHRDIILDDDDRGQFMLICCSRAKSPVIVLDI